MKVVFAGPSLANVIIEQDDDMRVLPPAAQGDVYAAVQNGANVVGLIDGTYENVAATWHKEILYALAQGVQVFGGASIGALRAAECAAFGMVGVGAVYEAYATGKIVSDADVALLHGPEELGHIPLTEALVDIRATLDHLLRIGHVSVDEHSRLQTAAERIFFKERTWAKILDRADLSPHRCGEIDDSIKQNAINQKLMDAQDVVKTVRSAENRRVAAPKNWQFVHTSQFNRLVATAVRHPRSPI